VDQEYRPGLVPGGVIRSIAWEWKSEGPPDATPSTDLEMEERNSNAAIDAAKIVALFDDDPVARNTHCSMTIPLQEIWWLP
jgi:hypothetical protein